MENENMKTKRSLKYWLKERHNPQTGVYYVKMGQMTKKAAKEYEDTLYGYNIMQPFDTEQQYIERISDLEKQGERVQ